MRILARRLIPFLDVVLWPFAVVSALCLRIVRRVGLYRLPLIRRSLFSVGVIPAARHYYDPFFDEKNARYSFDHVRDLPGVDLNVDGQLDLLRELDFAAEFTTAIRSQPAGRRTFHLDNSFFEAGDAELLYAMIRRFRPRMILEVGSGNSTLVARLAVDANERDDETYDCRHVCIEPFEAPWLAETATEVLRSRVETLDPALFEQLGNGDILFIDSSHVIRPQGDVVFEYLEILPRLRPGVIVGIHDIFTPRDYPREWIVGRGLLWDEQYLVEAFLSENPNWEIMVTANHLYHEHVDALSAVCPHLRPDREPSSLFLRRVR